eukprot:8790823-Alexandrium_andersonii.AAC.1
MCLLEDVAQPQLRRMKSTSPVVMSQRAWPLRSWVEAAPTAVQVGIQGALDDDAHDMGDLAQASIVGKRE